MGTQLVDLPDIQEIEKVIDEIYRISKEIARLKLEIKVLEAKTILELVNTSDGKAPSMNFIQSTFAVTGKNDELIELRAKLASLETKLKYYENKYDMYKMIVDIWRTQSANERLKL
ncbi:MAG: hypothetical protein QXV73_05125 [Candidatus Micrarchaeia archaeon]